MVTANQQLPRDTGLWPVRSVVLRGQSQSSPHIKIARTGQRPVSRWCVFALVFCLATSIRAEVASVVIEPNAAPRVQYGAKQLTDALKSASIDTGKIVITKGG